MGLQVQLDCSEDGTDLCDRHGRTRQSEASARVGGRLCLGASFKRIQEEKEAKEKETLRKLSRAKRELVFFIRS